ncbi:siderophore biosynthesis protein [Streptomyces sp. WM6372]|uniref:GNAT family N-acetyltransferase n=1 Tax=Streptomyces sp. WM6372 TaxID=1415555 RepID=UPI0006AFC67E|nr:GNAT family N-acetyltransferase [Streptomyces sp. WM6372]KOU19031.1 siderophore biosynthesis protein [Streptomyces sp. WM6372]
MRPESTVLATPRADVHTETIEDFGTVRFTPVDPATDSAVLHAWVVEERAEFWGMNGAGRELVQEIYEDVDRRDTHHAYMVRLDDEPVALFQTYQPEEDRVSECYEVREGDIGVHLMLAPITGRPRPGFSRILIGSLIRFVFRNPAVLRTVGEPDARNEKAIALLGRIGFVRQGEITLPEIDLPEIHLPEKRAVLAFLDRPEELAAVQDGPLQPS